MELAHDRVPRQRTDDLLRAATAVVEHLELDEVLGRIVEAAMSLVGARYGALGVLGPDGLLERFIHRGMPAEAVRRIGPPPRGAGILGAVIASPDPLRLEHLSHDPRSIGFPAHHPPMDSFLGVPIRVRGAVYGDLYLTERAGGPFTDDDEALIISLAATAGVAIENARLFESTRTREAWSAALADVMGAMLDVASDDALEVIVERVAPLVKADLVTLATPSATPSTLRIVAAKGRDAATLLGSEVPLDGTIAGRALAARRAVSAPGGLEADPESGPTVALPLLSGEEGLGVLTLSRRRGAPAFTSEELDMAFVFAGQAGVAIEVVRGREDRRRLDLAGDRARIARDLHDHVIQRIFGAGLGIQAVASSVEPDAAAALSEQIDQLDAAIKEIRTVIFALGSGDGTRRGGTRERLLGIATDAAGRLPSAPRLRFSGAVDTLVPPDLAEDLAAVLRECLSNVVRHAGATTVDVAVEVAGGEVRLAVSDDGYGIPADAQRRGLDNLSERARLRGGSFTVAPASGGGTQIVWIAPLEQEDGA